MRFRHITSLALLLTWWPVSIVGSVQAQQRLDLGGFSTSGSGHWTADFGLPGVSSYVYAIVSDGTRMYVGGQFNRAGLEQVNAIAAFDLKTAQWSSLGQGVNGQVFALALGEEGELYIGGQFTMAGGQAANRIARYDPDTEEWSSLGPGLEYDVFGLAVADDGSLFAGGGFMHDQSAIGLSRWDGESWTSAGTFDAGRIHTLAAAGDTLYVGGVFASVNGVQSRHIAALDITSGAWHALGQGVTEQLVSEVFTLAWADAGLFVGGHFGSVTQADGTTLESPGLARWSPDLQVWLSPGVVPPQWEAVVYTLGVHDGQLYAGTEGKDQGFFRLTGQQWEWLGFAQISPPHNLRIVSEIVQVGNRLAVAMNAYLVFGHENAISFLYSFDPADEQWGVFYGTEGGGLDAGVYAVAADADGFAYVGGTFRFAGSLPARYVARTSHGVWNTLGGGTSDPVRVLRLHSDGDLYVAGPLGTVWQDDGQSLEVSGIARWQTDVEVWTPLGGGVQTAAGSIGLVTVLESEPDGGLIVGGVFDRVVQPGGEVLETTHLARWNVTRAEWEALPSGHEFDRVTSLVIDPSGAIVASGLVPDPPISVGRISRLAPGGTDWEVLREWPARAVLDLAVWGSPGMAAGELFAVVGGEGFWRWNGDEWDHVGQTPYGLLVELNGIPGQGGRLYGGITSPTAAGNVVEWDGANWSVLGGGIGGFFEWTPRDLSIVKNSDGTASLWVGGFFQRAGDLSSSAIAEWLTKDYGIDFEPQAPTRPLLSLTAYPNPFSGTALLEFALPADEEVELGIYDLLGRRVQTLLQHQVEAGTRRVRWDANHLPAGTYIIRLSTPTARRAIMVSHVGRQ